MQKYVGAFRWLLFICIKELLFLREMKFLHYHTNEVLSVRPITMDDISRVGFYEPHKSRVPIKLKGVTKENIESISNTFFVIEGTDWFVINNNRQGKIIG